MADREDMDTKRDIEPGPAGPDAPGHGDPRALMTAVVAIVGASIIFTIIVALQAVFYHAEETERAVKILSVAPAELSELRARQQEELNSYRWIDQASGQVAIPIDRAMELTVRDRGRNPVTAAPASSAIAPSGSAAEAAPPPPGRKP